MKKITLLLILLMGASVALGQEAEDDSVFPEQDPLPKAGDVSIGFDAVPILEYFGNIFNGNTNNSISADFVDNRQQIFGKYFLTDKMAVRARVRIGQEITSNRYSVVQDNQEIFDPSVTVTDEMTMKEHSTQISGGVEYRKGEGRIIGIYGAELGMHYGTSSIDYDYGNPITVGNPEPTSTGGFVGGERPIEQRYDREMAFMLNGFAGVEYFIVPKVSLSAEFIWGVQYMKMLRGSTTYEYWSNVTNSVETREQISEGATSITLDTGNYGGSINLMFYF